MGAATPKNIGMKSRDKELGECCHQYKAKCDPQHSAHSQNLRVDALQIKVFICQVLVLLETSIYHL